MFHDFGRWRDQLQEETAKCIKIDQTAIHPTQMAKFYELLFDLHLYTLLSTLSFLVRDKKNLQSAI